MLRRFSPSTLRSKRTLDFAWTNASVLVLLVGLSPVLREALDAGIPRQPGARASA
ncbi:hypothetical protein JY651_09800 [Pyxidicoccus parkwayensis]|uniref:Uncharacterized protein n=1 Tax=Pyxidicoccus parkwayensis TaxID=2813578 RepID=A0ABX7P3Y2_9BACT|nr:hypothetical protein [Pyxidicoccus parkwaysis]QSQ25195.1 hypothetical protein JY651_09800 [Pyxidicoccus parkwaysis]